MGMGHAYLIENKHGMLLIDAGIPGQTWRVLKLMHAIGRDDLHMIFITHAHLDHYGCAAELQRLTGAKISIHRQDADAMARGETPLGYVRGWGKVGKSLLPLFLSLIRLEPTPADVILDDGSYLPDVGFEAVVIHTPGHTPGSSCLVVDGRYAFAGDLLTNNGTPKVQRYYAHNWSQIPNSLQRLQTQNPEIVYPGHGRRPLSRAELQAM